MAVSEWVRVKLGFVADERQRMVLDSTAKRGILNCSRQWGKSTVVSAKAVHRAFTEPKCLVLVASPSERQTGEFMRKTEEFLEALKLAIRGDGYNSLSFLLPNGSRIVGLPGKEASVRGFSAVSLLLIDEASVVLDEMYKSLRPMLAVKDGDLWMMSTPRGTRGFFWDTWVNGGPQWERIMAPVTECPRIKSTFLEDERRVIGDAWFRQEYLCEFIDDRTGWFKRHVVEAALDDDLEPLPV